MPRATLRPVWQTTVDLRDHDSGGAGMRLLAWSGIQSGDFLYVDRELMRVRELPGHPDADASLESHRGRRLAFAETTPEGHALNTPVYKVEMHPPGAALPSNGMPVFTLAFRNDDGGPGYGKDSRLTFTAPAAGAYLLRLRDSRGLSGREFTYRLTAAEARPDYRLSVNTTAPNVPRGGRVPVYVSVERRDGFDAPVEVALSGLGAGLQATTATLPRGVSSAALMLSATDVASGEPAVFRAMGRAESGGALLEREGVPDTPARLTVATAVGPPELVLTSVEPRVVELPAGGRAKVKVHVRRANGFAGRVPVGVQNLPFGVHIPDIGLNGVLITEKQEEREFYLQADPHAPPGERAAHPHRPRRGQLVAAHGAGLGADRAEDRSPTDRGERAVSGLSRRQLGRGILAAAAVGLLTAAWSAPLPHSSVRSLLYVAAPGIRDYLEYGGHGLLVFDIDDGHGSSSGSRPPGSTTRASRST